LQAGLCFYDNCCCPTNARYIKEDQYFGNLAVFSKRDNLSHYVGQLNSWDNLTQISDGLSCVSRPASLFFFFIVKQFMKFTKMLQTSLEHHRNFCMFSARLPPVNNLRRLFGNTTSKA